MSRIPEVRARVTATLVGGLMCLVACGGDGSSAIVLRDADDIQVMTPEEVAAMKATATTIAPGASTASHSIVRAISSGSMRRAMRACSVNTDRSVSP